VAEVIDEAARRFGPAFTEIVDSSRLWVNGTAAGRDDALTALDEVAVLPPVSGG
jgi:molybdopterin converting factor small subunit